MKYFSLFSGIGAFEKALDRLGVSYELAGFSEIDKYAAASYCAIHDVPETMNFGDITKINEKELPKDIDLITYGFPCQDISNAGKQKGLFNADGTQTRSGLFFDALRIIEETKPKVAIAENVKNLTSNKFSEQFKIVLDSLERAGYNNYFKVLNAKNFGIPQNRERVFIISIRKDIDTKSFCFPEAFPLELTLKNILEDSVDEKYYISETALNGLIERKKRHIEKGNGFGFVVKNEDEISPTITARYYKDGSECLIVREATKQGYSEAYEGDSVNLEHPNSKTRRGRVGKQIAQTLTTSPQQAVVLDSGNLPCTTRGKQIAGALRASIHKQGSRNLVANVQSGLGYEGVIDSELRLRKYTPLECFRLMNFDDADFEKAALVNSNTQLYKQAGNSIVVAVIEAIFKKLFEAGVL